MDGFWNIFEDTGDPICYLLYKAGQAEGTDKTLEVTGQETARGASA